MILHTDHYFSIGHAHLGQGSPCQDFALSGVHGDTAFAIVADGCSTGGLTDVGARLVALSTAQAIREVSGKTKDTDTIRDLIKTQQKAMLIASRRMHGLTQQDMLATCVFAVLSPQGGFVHLQGDGVVAVKYSSGHIIMYRYDWSDNIPAYLAYAEDNYAGFIAAQGGDVEAKRLTCEYGGYSSEKRIVTLWPDRNYSLGEGIEGITLPISPDELEFVAVFTDGVTQIEGQDWKEAVVQLLAFKNVEGLFAKRRMIRHIKDSQKSGKGPIDDIAYSVIRVQREEVPCAAQP